MNWRRIKKLILVFAAALLMIFDQLEGSTQPSGG